MFTNIIKMSSRLWEKNLKSASLASKVFLSNVAGVRWKLHALQFFPVVQIYMYTYTFVFSIIRYHRKKYVVQLEVLWRLHFFGDNGQYHTMFPRMLFQADIRCSQKLMTFIDFLFLFHVKWQNISEIEAVNSASWVGYLGIRTKTRRPLKQIYKPTEQNRSIHWRRRI